MLISGSKTQERFINAIDICEETDKLIDELNRFEQERAIREHEFPLNMIPDKKYFEKCGFQFEKITGDAILCKAKFPDGWSARIKDKCHTIIVDKNGIERAFYFYKTILSRNAYAVLHKRFFIGVKDVIEHGMYASIIIYIYDRQENKIIKEYEKCTNNWGKEYNISREDANNYLDLVFPNWKDPTEYWD